MRQLKKTDYHETPPEFFNWFCDYIGDTPDIDLCAEAKTAKADHFISEEEDFLATAERWKNCGKILTNRELVGWCNPPYSRKEEFIEACITSAKYKFRDIWMLLPASTDTAWFQKYATKAAEVIFLKPRVAFLLDGVPQTQPKNGSVLFHYSSTKRHPVQFGMAEWR